MSCGVPLTEDLNNMKNSIITNANDTKTSFKMNTKLLHPREIKIPCTVLVFCFK